MDIIYNILLTLGGSLILFLFGIIGYFVKGNLNDIKELKSVSNKTNSELEVLKNDHYNKYESMTEKFDELRDVMKDLVKEIKDLNNRMK